jgi:hypothetical protein
MCNFTKGPFLEWIQNKNCCKYNVTGNHLVYDIYQPANVLKLQERSKDVAQTALFKETIRTVQ